MPVTPISCLPHQRVDEGGVSTGFYLALHLVRIRMPELVPEVLGSLQIRITDCPDVDSVTVLPAKVPGIGLIPPSAGDESEIVCFQDGSFP